MPRENGGTAQQIAAVLAMVAVSAADRAETQQEWISRRQMQWGGPVPAPPPTAVSIPPTAAALSETFCGDVQAT